MDQDTNFASMTNTPNGGLIMTHSFDAFEFKCDSPEYPDSPVECYWSKYDRGTTMIKTPRLYHLTFKIPLSWVKDCVDQNLTEAEKEKEKAEPILDVLKTPKCPRKEN